MPHKPPQSPPSDGRDQPALATQDVCPNCERGPAVVFPAPDDREPNGEPKLVCLLCCQKPSDE